MIESFPPTCCGGVGLKHEFPQRENAGAVLGVGRSGSRTRADMMNVFSEHGPMGVSPPENGNSLPVGDPGSCVFLDHH